MRHTPCKTQWLRCSVVARSASNTRPTPMAFLLSEVTYTGVLKVFWSLRRWASMGMTFMTGRSWINCLGDCRIRQQFSRSQAAPSRYRPSMKQPANQNQCCFIKCSPWIQWKSRTFILPYLYSLEQRKAWITLMSSFCDIIGTLPLCDWGVESGLVQWPAILTTSGLYQSSQVRLWDVESREPHDRGLTLIHL